MNSAKEHKSDNSTQGRSHNADLKNANSSSGMLRRLLAIVVVFAVLAGGIWGYQEYLKSTMPKADPNFVKKKSDNAPPEVEATNMDLLNDMFSPVGPSKEVEELKKRNADEVVFTYDAIIAMTPEELEKNIAEVTARLIKVREDLPPSLGGASAGGPPKTTEMADSSDAPKDTATVPFLALPLEVMRQVAGGSN